MKFKIRWTKDLNDYYKNGSRIEYEKNGTVHFQNGFISAGAQLLLWTSNPNYQLARTFLQLPLLKHKQKYQLIIDAVSQPANNFFIMMTYYDRFDRMVDLQVFKENVNEFIYPENAYSYTVSLVNKGAQTIAFKELVIKD